MEEKGWGKGSCCGDRYFSTLWEYMILWCKIQEIINSFLQERDKKIFFSHLTYLCTHTHTHTNNHTHIHTHKHSDKQKYKIDVEWLCNLFYLSYRVRLEINIWEFSLHNEWNTQLPLLILLWIYPLASTGLLGVKKGECSSF